MVHSGVLGSRLSTQHLCGPHSLPGELVEPAGHLWFPEESSSSWRRLDLREEGLRTASQAWASRQAAGTEPASDLP